jgi:hypothetical protein
MESDMARTHDQLAVLAEMVNQRGMKFIVEFAPQAPSWTISPISTLPSSDMPSYAMPR